MSSLGMVVGMLTFGWISDKVGRKFGMVRAVSENSRHSSHLLFRCLLPSSLLFLPAYPPLLQVPTAALAE